MALLRHSQNPILEPTDNWWENKAVFNPGATIYRNKIYLLYRAIGSDNISRVGLAISEDGAHFQRRNKPLIQGEENDKFSRLGIEDARVTKFGDRFFIVFTEASVYPTREKNFSPSLASPTPWRVRLSCISTSDFKSFRHEAGWLPKTDTKDASLLPEKIGPYYVLFHRVYPDIYVSFSKHIDRFDKGEMIFSPGDVSWATERVGGGPPPMKTERGWVFFFHGTNKKKVYRLGAMLLDLKDPRKIIAVTKEPIFEPEKKYEKVGEIPNVVFTGGAIEKDGQFYVYYGGADRVVGLATIEKAQLLALLK